MRAPGGMPHPAIILDDRDRPDPARRGRLMAAARIKPPARAEGGPRCATCGRDAHRPGMPGSHSYHGHAYLAPKTVRAEANRQYVRDLLADKQPAYAAALELAIADVNVVPA